MVFTGKEGGSKGQAPFCAGNGDSSEDSVWNAVVYDDTLSDAFKIPRVRNPSIKHEIKYAAIIPAI